MLIVSFVVSIQLLPALEKKNVSQEDEQDEAHCSAQFIPVNLSNPVSILDSLTLNPTVRMYPTDVHWKEGLGREGIGLPGTRQGASS